MPQMSETVLAPELEGGQWIQHGPVSLNTIRATPSHPPVCGELLILGKSVIRHTQDRNGNIIAVAEAWQRAECVATDDPRLKETK